tara:strand:+ start:99 stop:851 length:753 start_codon:yes stop_codon:yes gene_type:complete
MDKKMLRYIVDNSSTPVDQMDNETKVRLGMRPGEKWQQFLKREGRDQKGNLKPLISKSHLEQSLEVFGDGVPKLENISVLNRNKKYGRPKPVDLYDKSTYMSNPEVKKGLDLWEQKLELAKNPKTKEDRLDAKDTRRMIMNDYNNPKMRKFIGDDELKLVGKHKSQLNRPVVTPVITPVIKTQVKEFNPRPPERDLIDIIEENSRMEPGLSEDFVKLKSDIKENMDYVMGKRETPSGEKEESQDPIKGDN